MAQAERQAEERKASKNARGKGKGSSKRGAASEGLQTSFLHWQYMIALTRAFLAHGGAVRVGLTRDGGAWAVGCYLADDSGTEYIRPGEIFEDAVDEIATAWLPDKGSGYRDILDGMTAELRAWAAATQ